MHLCTCKNSRFTSHAVFTDTEVREQRTRLIVACVVAREGSIHSTCHNAALATSTVGRATVALPPLGTVTWPLLVPTTTLPSGPYTTPVTVAVTVLGDSLPTST